MSKDTGLAPVVEVRGLVNRFGSQTVHDNLDLDILPREVLGVVGGSGTGKSVLLRSIVGLRRPNAGSVKVFGKDLQTLPPQARSEQERRFGVLFQRGALFSSLTVAENIAVRIGANPCSSRAIGNQSSIVPINVRTRNP